MEDTAPDKQPASDAKYMLIVSGLLMGIVILLSVLWMRERRNVASLTAQLRVASRGAITGQFSSNDMASLFAGPQMPQTRPLQREDLPAETVKWNGQPRTVLRVSASAGQRMGLKPGDVILIAPPPATQPATPLTPPSTRPGP